MYGGNGEVCYTNSGVKAASLRRITPSTQVGRLSESHTDIGFQLTQFPGKMAMERKGGRVSALGMLNKVCCMTAAGQQWKSAHQLEKGLGEYRANHHGSKPRKIRVTAWSTVWNKYTVGRPPLHQHLLASSSLDGKCQWCPVPLRGNCAMKIQCPWIRGLTHTHTHPPAGVFCARGIGVYE